MLCLPIILALFLYDLSSGKIPLVRINQSCWFYGYLLWCVWSYRVIVCLILWIISTNFEYWFNSFVLVRTLCGATALCSTEVIGKMFFVIKSLFSLVLLSCFCSSSCKVFEVIWIFRCTNRVPIYWRRVGIWIFWSCASFLRDVIIFLSSSCTRSIVVIFLGGTRSLEVISVIILRSGRWWWLFVILISIIIVLYRRCRRYVRLCCDFVTVC